MRGHGIGEDPGGHTRRRRRVEDVRPADDKGDPGRGIHPSDGQVQDRSLRGGPDPPGDRDRLYRRERGAIPGGRRPPHRQAQVRRALRMRGQGSRRGPQAHRRGRIHDQDQGRARHRRCDPGGLAHAHHEQADQGAEGAGGRRGLRVRQVPAGPAGPGVPGTRDGQAPRRQLRRRRHRHARGCGAHDAARRRGRVRRLGHLQVREPGIAKEDECPEA